MNRTDESETVRQIIVAVQKATPKPGDLIILNYDASAVDDSAAHEMNRRISEWLRDLLPGVLLLIFPNTVQARVDTLEHAIADLTAQYESQKRHALKEVRMNAADFAPEVPDGH